MKEFFTRFASLFYLIFLLLIKVAAFALLIQFTPIGLGPDEAQYWTWSKELALGFYSKPPGIAWQIALGTWYAGDTEFGVRSLSLLFSFLYPIGIYFIAWSCNLNSLSCFFAALLMALTPLGLAGSFFAITDGGMLLFWILAVLTVTIGLSNDKSPNYPLVGLFIALGALFKWPIYIFLVVILLLMPFYKNLRSKHFFTACAISLLGLIPTLWWNIEHDFVTFRHVFSTLYVPDKIAETKEILIQGSFLEFLGAQNALVTPFVFILFLIGFYYFIKDRKNLNSGLSFCGSVSFLLIGLFLFVSLFKKLQGNWIDFAYPTLFVFVAWLSIERLTKAAIWLKVAIGFSLALALLVFSYPALQQTLPFATPYKINPFKHNLGWNELPKYLTEVGYDNEKDFLFADKYQTVSVLSFYSPGQKRAYFLNIHGIRKNQFSFWPSMQEEQVGKDGFFVVVENSPHLGKLEDTDSYKNELVPYFEKVEYLGRFPLFVVDEKTEKEAAIFKGIHYNGSLPLETNLY